eukprot:TRINITY_DN19009_c0_g1_i2.p1 TRINITY_DN19009_c0_g1~~TRINITY_DN19009_c0_g1_i2.p1  ORF type:complete len:209 (-),score=29.55 TRINITY_DN19009_c0_g1_i2:17-643(-)
MKSSKSANEHKVNYCHSWLRKLFHTIYQNETTLEHLRVALHNQVKEFTSLFSKLDINDKHFLTSNDLWEFMQQQKLAATSEHAYSILKLHTDNERLTEDSLRSMLMPTVLRSSHDYMHQANACELTLFSMYLAKEIEFINDLSAVIGSLGKRGISVYDAYSLVLSNISRENESAITSLNVMEYYELSLIHICRCRRYAVCRSRWSPYH